MRVSAISSSRGNLMMWGLLLPVLLAGLFQFDSGGYVTRLFEFDGRIYAADGDEIVGVPPGRTFILARYDPSLNTWATSADIVEAAAEVTLEPAALPLTQCVNDSSICYRIEGDEQVLESNDGGQSWRTSWQVPAGRRLFMSRAAFLEGGRVEIGPYDLLVTGSGSDHRVFVAAGTEGVLLREGDGDWQRQGVLSARPTPFRATTLLEVMTTIPAELGGWLLFVLIYGVGQYLFFLRRLRYIFPPMTTAFLIFVAGGLVLAYRVLNTGRLNEWGIFLLICLTYCLPIFLAYRKWASESYKMNDEEKSKQAARFWFWSTTGLFFGGLLLLALWPLGLIPFYWLLVVLVLGATLGTAWWGSNRIQRLMEGN